MNEDKKTVQVPVTTLEKMEERMAEQDKQIEILKKASSKARLANAEGEEEIGMSVKVSTYIKDGSDIPLLVKSWSPLLKDDVRFTKTGEKEEQIMKFTLEDGTEIEMDRKDFEKDTIKEPVEVDLEKTTYNKDKSLKEIVFTWNGKETRISPTFVN